MASSGGSGDTSNESGDNFFSTLKHFAVKVESESNKLKHEVLHPESSLIEPSVAIVREIRKEMSELKESVNATRKKLRESHQYFSEVITIGQKILNKQLEETQRIQLYLQQYGYQPPSTSTGTGTASLGEEENKENVKPEKFKLSSWISEVASSSTSSTSSGSGSVTEISSRNQTHTNGDKIEDSSSIFKTPSKADSSSSVVMTTRRDPNKTPTMADWGISESGMKYIAELDSQARTRTATVTGYHGNNEPPLTAKWIQANFFTPSNRLLGQAESEIQDSPVVPILKTPGVKQIEKSVKREVMDLGVREVFNSPVPPILKTPGVCQVVPLGEKVGISATDDPNDPRCIVQLDDALAQEETIQFEHALSERLIPNGKQENMDTPEPPDLTTIQLSHYVQVSARHEMTTQSTSDQVSARPEMTTQSTSDQVSEMNTQSHPRSPVPVKQEHFFDSTPCPPQLTGRYDFIQQDPAHIEQPKPGLILCADPSLQNTKCTSPSLSSRPLSHQTHTAGHQHLIKKEQRKLMSHVTYEEFHTLADVIKNQLSLEIINQTIDNINQVISNKVSEEREATISPEDLNLGQESRKTKTILLLLVTLKRLVKYETGTGSKQTFKVA